MRLLFKVNFKCINFIHKLLVSELKHLLGLVSSIDVCLLFTYNPEVDGLLLVQIGHLSVQQLNVVR